MKIWKYKLIQYSMLLVVIVVLFGLPNYADASLVNRTSSSNLSLSNGLVGHWTFDGKDIVNGVVLDKSGNGNNGTPVGIASSTFYSMGKIGQGGKFDGTDDYVTSQTVTFGSKMSFSFWIKTNATAGTFMSWRHTRFCALGSGATANKLVCTVDGDLSGGSRTTSVINDDKWHHIAYLVDGNEQYIYIDGVQEDILRSETLDTTSGTIIAGKREFGGYGRANMDDVRVYNRTLTVTEIKQLYNLGKTSINKTLTTNTDINTGMLGWWTFDGKDTTSAVTNDISGKGLTATLQEIDLPKPVVGKLGQGMSFDGANNYATIVSNPLVSGDSTLSTPNSICAWAYLNSPTTNGSGAWDQTILNFMTDTSNGVRLSNDFSSGGGFVASYRVGGTFHGLVSSTVVFKTKTWTHVCYTWDGATVILYADGQALSGSASSNALGDVNVIGARDDVYNGMWDGNIDDIRVYARALTPSDVMQVYNQGVSTVNKTSSANPTLSGSGSGLVGWWTMDGKDTVWSSATAGTIIDKSGNGNTGTLTNMTQAGSPTMGKIGQGLQFDGTNDSVVLNGPAITTTHSFSFWIKPQLGSDANYSAIIMNSSASPYNGIFFRNNTRKISYYYSGDHLSNTALTLNVWSHVAISVNAGSVTFYLNGVADGTASSASAWTIRRLGWNNFGELYKGILDDVRVYNRALSVTEVRQLYNIGR